MSTATPESRSVSGRHPVVVTHLVMGLVLLGFVAAWAVVRADLVGGSDLRWLLPLPWLVAGAAGLTAVATAGLRRRRPTDTDTDTDTTLDTDVLDHLEETR